MCHLAVTCCQRLGDWARPPFITLQTEMMVKEDGGHRGPGTEQCLLTPYVPTAHLSLLLRPSDPEHLGCRFWGLGLAIKFTASSASQERGGRRRRRGFQKSRMTDCAGRRQESETSGAGQRHGKPKGTVFQIFPDHPFFSSA